MKPEDSLVLTRYVVAWYKCKIPLKDRIFHTLEAAADYLGDQKRSYKPRIEKLSVGIHVSTVPKDEYST